LLVPKGTLEFNFETFSERAEMSSSKTIKDALVEELKLSVKNNSDVLHIMYQCIEQAKPDWPTLVKKLQYIKSEMDIKLDFSQSTRPQLDCEIAAICTIVDWDEQLGQMLMSHKNGDISHFTLAILKEAKHIQCKLDSTKILDNECVKNITLLHKRLTSTSNVEKEILILFPHASSTPRQINEIDDITLSLAKIQVSSHSEISTETKEKDYPQPVLMEGSIHALHVDSSGKCVDWIQFGKISKTPSINPIFLKIILSTKICPKECKFACVIKYLSVSQNLEKIRVTIASDVPREERRNILVSHNGESVGMKISEALARQNLIPHEDKMLQMFEVVDIIPNVERLHELKLRGFFVCSQSATQLSPWVYASLSLRLVFHHVSDRAKDHDLIIGNAHVLALPGVWDLTNQNQLENLNKYHVLHALFNRVASPQSNTFNAFTVHSPCESAQQEMNSSSFLDAKFPIVSSSAVSHDSCQRTRTEHIHTMGHIQYNEKVDVCAFPSAGYKEKFLNCIWLRTSLDSYLQTVNKIPIQSEGAIWVSRFSEQKHSLDIKKMDQNYSEDIFDTSAFTQQSSKAGIFSNVKKKDSFPQNETKTSENNQHTCDAVHIPCTVIGMSTDAENLRGCVVFSPKASIPGMDSNLIRTSIPGDCGSIYVAKYDNKLIPVGLHREASHSHLQEDDRLCAMSLACLIDFLFGDDGIICGASDEYEIEMFSPLRHI